MSLQQNIFKLIDEDNKAKIKINDRISSFIMLLIILSIVSVILESDEFLEKKYINFFYYFELFAVVIFTIEYLSRIYTARLAYPHLSATKAILKYIFSPMAIIDLLAILPFYILLGADFFGVSKVIDMRFIRVLRLMRLLRIFKLNRYSSSMKLIGAVMKEEKEKLIMTLFMTGILLVLASALVFTVENDGQPDAFPNIYSSMWWAIATLTTVGYGDVYPMTGLGKILAGVIALLGIGLVALPTGILSGSFVQAMNDEKQRAAEAGKERSDSEPPIEESNIQNLCPHCGKDIHDHGP